MAELLIGCGNHRTKLIRVPDGPDSWSDLVTLDSDPNCGADHEWDLERLPLPFAAESFDEIHAYHVLEHTGRQGDYRFFFAQWSDFWRILKPGGHFFGIVPSSDSVWVFGDPGHCRVIRPEMMTFLCQPEYDAQVGKTAFCDYRHVYRADFDLIGTGLFENDKDQTFFALKAVKPSRISR